MSKIDEARAAGYSDDEILSHMSKAKPKLADALKEGYSATEILSHLGGTSTNQSAPAAEEAPKERSLGDALWSGAKNFLPGVGNLVKDTATAVMNPGQTLSGMADLARGAAMKIPGTKMNLSPEQTARAEGAVNALAGEYGDRYGSWAGFKNSLAENPVGPLLDLSTVLSGGAALAGKTGQVGGALSKAATLTNPLAPVEAGVNALASGGGKLAGKIADSKRKADIAAGEIARQAAGSDLDVIRAANAANPNAPSSVAAAGVSGDAYQALAAKGGQPDMSRTASELTQLESDMMQYGDRMPPEIKQDMQRRINAAKAQLDTVNQNALQASTGEAPLNALVREGIPSPSQLPRVPQGAKYIPGIAVPARLADAGVMLANGALDLMQGKLKDTTITKLSEGMRTGKSANELLATLPTSEQSKLIQLLRSNPKWLTRPEVLGVGQGVQVLESSRE
jgi:hypothetical protein